VHEADLHIKKQLPDEKSPHELFPAIESPQEFLQAQGYQAI
jgi:hypothetical protein